MTLDEIIKSALGEKEADILLTNVRIIDAHVHLLRIKDSRKSSVKKVYFQSFCFDWLSVLNTRLLRFRIS